MKITTQEALELSSLIVPDLDHVGSSMKVIILMKMLQCLKK